MQELKAIYEALRGKAILSDPTLEKHVLALQAKAIKRLEELESKMKRAERRRMSELRFQIEELQHRLFPGGGLQERRENAAVHYARYGNECLEQLYRSISVWEPLFTWLKEVD